MIVGVVVRVGGSAPHIFSNARPLPYSSIILTEVTWRPKIASIMVLCESVI